MKIMISSNTEWYLYNYRLPLAKFLSSKGWEVVFISPVGPYAEKLVEHGFRWSPWDLGRKTLAPWSELGSIQALTEIYKTEAPDVVHHHTIKPAIYGSIAAARAGVNVIVNSITGRGYVFIGNDLRTRLLRSLVIHMYRRAFRPRNVRTIFENRADQAYFIEKRLILEHKTELIESSGVDVDVFTPSSEPEGLPVVMMAARMLWDKGVQEFVDAARLIGAPAKARVVLVGEPDEGNPNAVPIETLNQFNDDGIIEWWGFKEDMNATLARCHIFVLPTKYTEGLPVSLLEAAACQRPIVTTRVPGAEDFVVDGLNGILVEPGDAIGLADAMERLVQDANLRGTMGAAGRKRVLEKYTSDIVNKRTLSVYNDLLSA